MELFLSQLVNGLSLGSIYALIALGYTMVYGTIKLINFAHGEIFMMGGFVGFYLIVVQQMNFYLALICSVIFCVVLGVLIERIAYKPLRNSSRIAALITAIGVSYFLQNIMIYFFGAEVKSFPTVGPQGNLTLFNIQISYQQVLIFSLTIILMLALHFIVQKTKMGKAMRAVSVDEEAARLMGINVDQVISFTFALGSSLAGVAGVLIGLYYNAIFPTIGTIYGLKAFVAAVLGGIGSIPGAMVGGYAIGLLETIIDALGGSQMKDGLVYFLLIVILLVLPAGLLGKNRREKV